MLKERVVIFIDGSNLYHNLKRYSISLPFEEIIKRVETKRKVIKILYYTAFLDKSVNEEGYFKHIGFLDNLKKIPNFKVILCRLRKIILQDGSVEFKIKGNDVFLATDLIKGAYENLYDVAIVISGDADFIPAINLVRKKGKKVINAFFPKSSSYLLRKCCDGSINLRKTLS